MRKSLKIAALAVFALLIATCKKQESHETILEGTATVLVDETLAPIIEDQVQVFESRYNAKVKIQSKSEAEVIQSLVNDQKSIAILSRQLTAEESKVFAAKKLVPRITPFAKDAIALISHSSNKDTLIALNDVVSFLQGKGNARFKGLVFDNPNSSTARYICERAGLKALPENGVFSFKTNDEVIRYVADNENMIGVIGLNHLYEPTPEMQPFIDRINVLQVQNPADNQYYSPTQNNIAEGKYPLARDLYVVNCQGYAGLGMGFASFIAGETGQRIVLKSGLVPAHFPSRKILIRNKINNDKK